MNNDDTDYIYKNQDLHKALKEFIVNSHNYFIKFFLDKNRILYKTKGIIDIYSLPILFIDFTLFLIFTACTVYFGFDKFSIILLIICQVLFYVVSSYLLFYYALSSYVVVDCGKKQVYAEYWVFNRCFYDHLVSFDDIDKISYISYIYSQYLKSQRRGFDDLVIEKNSHAIIFILKNNLVYNYTDFFILDEKRVNDIQSIKNIGYNLSKIMNVEYIENELYKENGFMLGNKEIRLSYNASNPNPDNIFRSFTPFNQSTFSNIHNKIYKILDYGVVVLPLIALYIFLICYIVYALV